MSSISSISTSHFGWLSTPTAWSQTQAFDSAIGATTGIDSATIANSFADASVSFGQGLANLAAEAAAKRLGVNLSQGQASPANSTSSASSSGNSANATSGDAGGINDYQAFLASLDQMAMPDLSAAASAADTDGSVAGAENMLSSLDAMNMELPTNIANPTADSPDFVSFLQNLDAISAMPVPTTNITA